MSNALAIAAVTATLQRMLNDTGTGLIASLPPGLPGTLNLNSVYVTAKPPDKARAPNDNTNQVNLFLYQTLPNAAWRNMDMPRQVRPGETAQPPVALTLHYLLTVYAQDDDDTAAHVLLGDAMRIFHDHAVLDQDDIQEALPGNDLYLQFERVRISPMAISVEDICKLWTAFATSYRISAAFEVSAVLIESTQPASAPLPVLARGKGDTGVSAQASMISSLPTLLSVILAAAAQPSALLGQQITLRGHHLSGDGLAARFTNLVLDDPIDLALNPVATDAQTNVPVTLPDDAAARAAWVAGFYSVALVVTDSTDPTDPVRVTNGLPLTVAPRILSLSPVSASATGGDFTLTVTCAPNVRPTQRASLLFGNREILADPHAAATGTLTFAVSPVTASSKGDHYVRLRVDGVDSLLVDFAHPPLAFDPAQKVTIT